MARQINISRGPKTHENRFGAKMPEGGWKTVGRLFKYVVSNYKLSLVVVFLCIIITSVTTLTSSLFTRTLIDDFIGPISFGVKTFNDLSEELVRLAAILSLGIICSYVNTRLMINVGQGTLLRLRKDIFSHMESLPIKYFDQHSHGQIMSVYTNDVDTLRQMIGNTIPMVFSSLLTISLTLISMAVLSIPLTILVILMTTLMFYITRWLGNRSAAHFRTQQQSLGEINGYIEEMLTGQKVIKTFCHERQNMEQFSKLNEALRNSAYNANRVANIVMPVNGNMSNLVYVLAAVFGGVIALQIGGNALSISSTLTVGTLVAFLTLIKNFTQPVSHVSQQINSVINALAGANRVFDLLDEKAESDEKASVTLVNAVENTDGILSECEATTGIWAWKIPQKDGSFNLVRQKGEVDFSNVDFGYLPDKQVLFDISLDTEAGQKVALVGGTGAGKTTITNLINRFYDIQGGTILYDNIDIRKIYRNDLRRSLGIVLQETHLFSGTVMDNIRYGRLEATDEECIKAAKLVNAHNFIIGLANGYNTMLTADGGNLSQGERQLIAIARAAVANPPALILDEATSSIDTRTEKYVQQGMDHIMEGRSTFVIAHRLSTIRNSDIIVVMENGRIIEQGTHQELIQLHGKYYQLNNI